MSARDVKVINMTRSDSSSGFQREMEAQLFNEVCNRLNDSTLVYQPVLIVKDVPRIFIQPDFYSAEHQIIGEIHVHAGRLKSAQADKIASDILKMLLYDKTSGIQHRKLIVVCDDDEYAQLSHASSLAESIRQFNIEIIKIDIDPNCRERLISVMKRQNLLN